jgi:hypothetical protein
MSPDSIDSDAELLRKVIEGQLEADSAGARALFERRPEWRELAAACRDVGAELPAALADASEEDRRLVAECLAAARRRPPGGEPRRRPGGRRFFGLLIGLAAAALLAMLVRAWFQGEPLPKPDGTLLGPESGLDCLSPGESVPEFDSFAWSFDERLAPKGYFVLTVFVWSADGARGPKLYEQRTRAERLEVPAEVRASWPQSILWRVEVVDSNGLPGDSCEKHAQRLPR